MKVYSNFQDLRNSYLRTRLSSSLIRKYLFKWQENEFGCVLTSEKENKIKQESSMLVSNQSDQGMSFNNVLIILTTTQKMHQSFAF